MLTKAELKKKSEDARMELEKYFLSLLPEDTKLEEVRSSTFEFHVDVLPTEVGVQEKDFYVGHILCCLRRGGWEITVPKLDKAYLTTRMQLQTDIKRTKQEIKALEDRIERIENVISNFKLAYERTFEVLGELQNVI